MMSIKRRFPYIVLLCIALPLVLNSCNSAYPTQLVEADSLLLQGDCQQADSLLMVFDCTHHEMSERISMYRELLTLERRFVESRLTSDDFSMADSLARYYKKSRRYARETAMAQIFLGDVYRVGGDYPSALDCYLQAEQMATECKDDDLVLQMWVNMSQGNLYFEQRMLSECTDFYMKFYQAAFRKHDMRRMALSSFSMGRVYMIKSDVDSILFYLNQAIELGKGLPQEQEIVDPIQSVLADIYTQMGEYDKAAALLPRDTINYENWAYWHLGQHHTDSAIFYFKQILGHHGWRANVTCLQHLAALEEEKGNLTQSFAYLKELDKARDSLKTHSQVEETRKVKAQHDMNLIRQERDAKARHSEKLEFYLALIVIIFAIAAIMVAQMWQSYRNKKEKELAQEKRLRQEEERINRQSAEQVERNERQIELLEQQLAEARESNDTVAAEKLQLEAQLLLTENESIRARQEHSKAMKEELKSSALFERIKLNAGKERFHLSDEEWQQLGNLIDQAYDLFTVRLYNLHEGITGNELQICYLVKIGVPSTDIGTMLYKSKAAIGMARQRLYKKLTGKNGTAKQFNEFIKQF